MRQKTRLSLYAASAAVLLLTVACSGNGGSSDGEGSQVEPELAQTSDPLILKARDLFKVIPLNTPKIDGVVSTPELVELGKTLFFEPRLSATHSISCASCHNPGLAGADNSPFSAGFHGARGGRNSPTVLNAVFNFTQFWDGRAKDLIEQAGGPLVNPVEMASPKAHVTEQLLALPGYATLFAAAFPGQKEPVTLQNAQIAIAAFEATLTTPNAPFDKYLRGEATALDGTQKAGLSLFIDKGCAACHGGTNLGGTMYQKFGVTGDPGPIYRPVNDKGRGGVTGNAAEDYFFKVPTLRNIELTAPYFHTGSEPDLKKTIDVMAKVQMGQTLSATEIDQIAAFLGSLTGDQPKVTVPKLPASDAKSPAPDK